MSVSKENIDFGIKMSKTRMLKILDARNNWLSIKNYRWTDLFYSVKGLKDWRDWKNIFRKRKDLCKKTKPIIERFKAHNWYYREKQTFNKFR